jgi:hypothetical protein
VCEKLFSPFFIYLFKAYLEIVYSKTMEIGEGKNELVKQKSCLNGNILSK